MRLIKRLFQRRVLQWSYVPGFGMVPSGYAWVWYRWVIPFVNLWHYATWSWSLKHRGYAYGQIHTVDFKKLEAARNREKSK